MTEEETKAIAKNLASEGIREERSRVKALSALRETYPSQTALINAAIDGESTAQEILPTISAGEATHKEIAELRAQVFAMGVVNGATEDSTGEAPKETASATDPANAKKTEERTEIANLLCKNLGLGNAKEVSA